MTFKVILTVPNRDDTTAREELLRRYKLDYTDLLELTLIHWELLQSGDDDVLKAALEHHFQRRGARRKKMDYAELLEALHLLATALAQFHRAIEPILTVVVANHRPGMEPEFALVGWNSGSPVIEVKPRPE